MNTELEIAREGYPDHLFTDPFAVGSEELRIKKIKRVLRDYGYFTPIKINEGGFHEIFWVNDLEGNDYAVKIPLDDNDDNEPLRIEYEVLGGLSHDQIPGVYELIEDDGLVMVVMDYLNAISLSPTQYRRKPRKIARLGLSLIPVLRYLHEKGIFHSDIKPENLLFDKRVLLHDFDAVTREGEDYRRRGTACYMAPETLLDYVVDERTEAFQAGATLMDLMHGETPFKPFNGSIDPFETYRLAITHGRKTVIPKPRSHMEEYVNMVIAGLTKEDPRKRFSLDHAENLLEEVFAKD